jgi:hypothetical protein
LKSEVRKDLFLLLFSRYKSQNYLIDIYAIFLIYIIPSNFFGFMEESVQLIPGVIDKDILILLMSLILLVGRTKYIGDLLSSISGKLLLLVIVFIIFNFFITIYSGQSFQETATIFRKRFFSPIVLLPILLFFYSIPLERILKIIRWLFILFVLNMFLYLANNMGIKIMYENPRTSELVNGILFNRNIIGFPPYFNLLLLLIIYKYVKSKNKYLLFILLVGVLTSIISATRSIIGSLFISFFILFIIIFIKEKNYSKRKARTIIFTNILFFAVLFSINFVPLEFITAKMHETFNYELKNDAGTYSLREELIGKAIYSIYTENNLFLRLLPIAYFFVYSLQAFKVKYNNKIVNREFRYIIFILIIISAIAYVQTSIFLVYTDTLLFFYLFQIMEKKFIAKYCLS